MRAKEFILSTLRLMVMENLKLAQVNDYAQNNFQNTSDGNQASTEWVATSPNGDDSNYYIDLGINGASWDGTAANSLYNNVGQRDGWLYVQGGNAGGGRYKLV